MSTTIYDSSLLTMRRQQKAESGSYLTRVAQATTTPLQSVKALSIQDQSIINDVRRGQMSYYRKANGVFTVDNGCPCGVGPTNPIIPQ